MIQQVKIFLTGFLLLAWGIVAPALAGGTYYLKVGDTERLSFTPVDGIRPETATWTSSRPFDVLITDYNGTTATIKAAKSFSGKAIVQCRYYYIVYSGSFPYQLEAAEDFTVYVDPVSPVSVSIPGSMTLEVGESATLSPVLAPPEAETTFEWRSSDYSVATVDASGRVEALHAGRADITVTTDNSLSATCRLTVEEPSLTLRATPSGGWVEKGTTVSLAANMSDADIYYTTDGAAPAAGGDLYVQPIRINRSLTLKAVAVHPRYGQSPVLTEEYGVSTLQVSSCFPENNASDVATLAIPCVTFNGTVMPGSNFDGIRLAEGGSNVAGEPVCFGSVLYFVPDSPLEENATYKLTIPAGAVVDHSSEPNFAHTSSFATAGGEAVPVPVSIAAGQSHTAIVKSDGSLWTWGGNFSGQLGTGGSVSDDEYAPVYVRSGVAAVYAGAQHTMVLRDNGSLLACGWNLFCQLGDGTTSIQRNTLSSVMSNVAIAAAGEDCTAAIKRGNTLWTWGQQISATDGDEYLKKIPTQVMIDVIFVATGCSNFAAIKEDYTLWTRGRNDKGQLGNGNTENSYVATQVMEDVVDVDINYEHAAAIKDDHTLWTWGDNEHGQLGTGSTDAQLLPVCVMEDVSDVATGLRTTAAIKDDGSLWMWGDNSSGQYGNGTTESSLVPVKVMDDVSLVDIGYGHTVVVKTDGSLWAWGDNNNGQLGDGTNEDRLMPVKIMEGRVLVEVEGMHIDRSQAEMGVGDRMVLQPVLEPSDAQWESIFWESSNEEVASVSQRGVVAGQSVGKADIWATLTASGGRQFTASCTVAVGNVSSVSALPSSPFHVWAGNGLLHVDGLEAGEMLSVYNAAGELVFQGKGNGLSLDIPAKGNGIYIVRTGSGKVQKVVCMD